MAVLHLTSNFTPNLGDPVLSYKAFIFPGGESHVRIDLNHVPDSVTISIRLNTADDIMRLALAVDALRRAGVETIEAFIPYIPYGRQDRVANPGEPLSISVFAGILNNIGDVGSDYQIFQNEDLLEVVKPFMDVEDLNTIKIMSDKKYKRTIDLIDQKLLENSKLKELAFKLNCTTSDSDNYPKGSIMTFEKICEHDDGYLCEHRLEYILNYVQENFQAK